MKLLGLLRRVEAETLFRKAKGARAKVLPEKPSGSTMRAVSPALTWRALMKPSPIGLLPR